MHAVLGVDPPGQLEHPGIVPVYELSVDENGQVFYTMKMVRGVTLKKVLALLAEGVDATVQKYSLPALLTIFQKVCDALAFALCLRLGAGRIEDAPARRGTCAVTGAAEFCFVDHRSS